MVVCTSRFMDTYAVGIWYGEATDVILAANIIRIKLMQLSMN